MNDFVINNNSCYDIDMYIIEIIDTILKELIIDNVTFSINIISDLEISKINNDYRDKECVTDVITFVYEEIDDFNHLFDTRELGDIFIAIDHVINNSKKYGHSIKREISFVVAHGILHLLGYDHMTKEEEEVMFSLQEKLINSIKFKGSDINEIFNK
ncbi:MAG: rRNA maturation RNase YbeY [Bacilli bacterium]